MRIGPFKFKLKPIIVFTPLFFLPIGIYNWYDYRQTNLGFKKKEDDIVLQTQLTTNLISNKQFPTIYFDPLQQFYISMDECEGQIKVFIFSDQPTYKRTLTQMSRQLKRFQIQYYNIIHQDQLDKLSGSTNVLTISDKIENQLIVTYNNNIIYQNILLDKVDRPIEIIERQITKMIDKEFLSKIKF